MVRLRPLSSTPSVYRGLPTGDARAVREAVVFSKKNLSTILRRSGESYAAHGLEVAVVLREAVSDISLLRVAVLHDLPIHPQGELLLAESPLSPEERRLVLQMHHLRRLHIDANTRDLDRVVDAFMEDARLLPLRMAHRLNDIRHLDRFTPQLRRGIAYETLHMYTAIAGRLGMQTWRMAMEDPCFYVLQPKTARSLRKKFDQYDALDQACLLQGASFLRRELRKQGIKCHIVHRIKGLYSTYRKMILKDRRFDELTDRIALRVFVPTVMDCYLALGAVHSAMHPMPGKLKDYIGAPKENGYQSVHTVVFPLPGVTEQPIEIQIRTRDMHELCEFGSSSHGEYKESLYALRSRPARVNLFRNLQSLREESRSPKQFEEALRSYFREDHAAIFDERNNLYHLRKPLTALDFTCHAYPKRWMKLASIRINGRLQPMDTALQDGDIVEPHFGRESVAVSSWEAAARLPSTRSALRVYLAS